MKVKLADFGLACKFDPNDPPTMKCGSIVSVAPEILTDDHYCFKVDMWGLGVILHELFSTKLPFYHEDEIIYKQNIIEKQLNIDSKHQIWSSVSTEAKELVERLLDKNPLTRISAS